MTATFNVEALVNRLAEHYAQLPDERDAKSQNERADRFAAKKTTADLRSTLRNLPNDLADVEAQLRALEESRATVFAKRTEIEKSLAEAPDPTTITDVRDRDQEIERQRQLRLQLELLVAGRLWRGMGQNYPPLTYLDERIAEVTTRIEVLRGNLEHYVREAEALLAAVPLAS